MSFNGYLVKIGSYSIPMQYIQVGSYKVNPKQRQEMYAYRNYSGYLYRSTMGHTPSKIEFTTTVLTGAEVAALMAGMGVVNNLQRRVAVSYYNPETNGYASGIFYMPNMDFTIDEIVNGEVLYKPIRLAWIEY